MKKINNLYVYDETQEITKYNRSFYFFEILKIYLYPEFWKDRVKIINDGIFFPYYQKQIMYIYFDNPIYCGCF